VSAPSLSLQRRCSNLVARPPSRNKRCAPRNIFSLHHVALQSSLPSRPQPHFSIPLPIRRWKRAPNTRWSRHSAGAVNVRGCVEWTRKVRPKFLSISIFLCWHFSSTEGQIRMAVGGGDYPRTRDRVGRIALLIGRYIVLLVAIRALKKIMVCSLLLLTSSVC
jgi:hypothetical protein